MSKKIKLIVVKVPLTEPIPDTPIAFPPMPQLYLELLENKAKLKPNLIDAPIPTSIPTPITEPTYSDPAKPSSVQLPSSSSQSPPSQQAPQPSLSSSHKDHHQPDYSSKYSSDYSSKYSSELVSEPVSEPVSRPVSEPMSEPISESVSEPISESKQDRDEEMEAASKLFQAMGDDSQMGPSFSSTNQPTQPKPHPPSLDEIQMRKPQFHQGVPIYDVRHKTSVDIETEEVQELRRDLLFRFEIMRKSYPEVQVPEFNEYSDIKAMKQTYERLIRHISLDSTVDTYKKFMIGLFIAIEIIGTKFLKIDFEGFTVQQVNAMNKYERLLIEMGEKNYLSGGQQYPVELRLLFLVIINAALFVGGKLIAGWAGPELAMVFGQIFGGAKPKVHSSPSSYAPRRKKKHMRGPSVRFDDSVDTKSKTD